MTLRTAPVQSDPSIPKDKPGRKAGTISWHEHEETWQAYAAKYGKDQSAERIAQRGGFGYAELTRLLGHEPTTWTDVVKNDPR